MNTFTENFWTGWPFNLTNGIYYLSSDIPKYYIFLNLFYKSPEFILICYLIFIAIFFISKDFFQKKIKFFIYKIFLLLLILLLPYLVLFLIPYPVYDGMRLFLWVLPYFCIIPGLTIYYLIENFRYLVSKITFSILSIFIIYFLFNFLTISPYQYTYLNIFNGKKENRYKKFENDYWGVSINELIQSTNFDKNKNLLIGFCGINKKILESSLVRKGYKNFRIVDSSKAEYIVMTNRVVLKNEELSNNFDIPIDRLISNLVSCFDKYNGNDIFKIERNGIILSVVRQKI